MRGFSQVKYCQADVDNDVFFADFAEGGIINANSILIINDWEWSLFMTMCRKNGSTTLNRRNIECVPIV